MYVLVIYCKNIEILTLTLTLEELQWFSKTITASNVSYELIKNKKSMYFDDIEELRLFIKEN